MSDWNNCIWHLKYNHFNIRRVFCDNPGPNSLHSQTALTNAIHFSNSYCVFSVCQHGSSWWEHFDHPWLLSHDVSIYLILVGAVWTFNSSPFFDGIRKLYSFLSWCLILHLLKSTAKIRLSWIGEKLRYYTAQATSTSNFQLSCKMRQLSSDYMLSFILEKRSKLLLVTEF